MSGDADQLGRSVEGAPGRAFDDPSEVEAELRFHLDLMVERLCAEGYERSEAQARARQRFGDLDALAEECAAQRAGPLGVALRWLITPSASVSVVAVATLAAVVDPPLALVGVLMPVSLTAGACAALAAVRPEWSGLAVRAGRRVLGLLCLLAFVTFLFSCGDWVHSLWSIQFPLCGLLFGSGLLLIRVWPEDRGQPPELLRGWNAATVALLVLLILGSLTLLLPAFPLGTRPVDRLGGSALQSLLEVARYGFGGELPATLQPHGAGQVERGLGIPPRSVTVTMGSSLLAACSWILFVLLALVGRAIQAGESRRYFLLVSPLFLAPAAFLLLQSRTLYEGLWRNEPWLVKSYGPALLLAAVLTLVLLLALRRDGRAAGRAG